MSVAIQVPAGSAHAHVDMTVRVQAELNITPYSARQKVNRLLMAEVGDRVGGETPELVVSDSLRWRVPVFVYSSTQGRLGQVGSIDVEVDTGEVLADEGSLREIERHAAAIAAGAPS